MPTPYPKPLQYGHKYVHNFYKPIERHWFTNIDEQQLLLANAVDHILAKPFTVREPISLSRHAREGFAAICSGWGRRALPIRLVMREQLAAGPLSLPALEAHHV